MLNLAIWLATEPSIRFSKKTSMTNSGTSRSSVLLQLAAVLDDHRYAFLCPTPESLARVHARSSSVCQSDRETAVAQQILTSLFGWSLPVENLTLCNILSQKLVERLIASGIFECHGSQLRSTVRISNLYMAAFVEKRRMSLYIHSAYPTRSRDAVFFGPDTYLFLAFIERFLISSFFSAIDGKIRTAVDVACGAGAGAIALKQSNNVKAALVYGLDLNPKALELAEVNAGSAGVAVQFLESDLFRAIAGRTDIDLIVSNPPYIASSEDIPLYCDGGTEEGLALPFRIIDEAMETLADNGTLLLYTGVPIPFDRPDHDPLLAKLKGMPDFEMLSYEILLPDIFGEELSSAAYARVGRIQAVGTTVRKKKDSRRIRRNVLL